MPEPERKVPSRPVDWRGQPTRAGAELTAWYRAQLEAAGLIHPEPPYYAPALPDPERKHEP